MKCFLSSLLVLLTLQSATAQEQNKESAIPFEFEMVRVQGGSFDMGNDSGALDKRPAHTVKLKDYYIGAYEVTQQQWDMIMGDNPSAFYCGDCPVTNVSWNDAQEFIKALNERTGKHYRLPTEAEWEFAARGGVYEQMIKKGCGYRGGVNEFLVFQSCTPRPDKYRTGKHYSGKEGPQPVAWYIENSRNRPHPVGRKKHNGIGVYDMSGNVEEWVADWYAGNYGSSNTVENPQGPVGGNSRVVRGGGFESPAIELIVTNRKGYVPTTKSRSLGFRLAEDR